MRNLYTFIIALLLIYSSMQAQDLPFDEQEFEQRKERLMTKLMADHPDNEGTATIRAFKGLPISQATIDFWKQRRLTSGEYDFNIIHMIRVLYFSDGQYDSQILPLLVDEKFWLTPNENLRVYWSENHTIMWLSSAYLLRQKYGFENAPNIDKNLEHWLDLKIKYGFYEFFSSVYLPFTMGAMLNLVDFAEDPVIKQKAIIATERFLKEILMLVNDKGALYPASGRNALDKFTTNTMYNQATYYVVHILTGFGPDPRGAAGSGSSFLLTSSFNPKNVVESWKSKEDQILKIGHTLQEGFAFNSVLSQVDKTIFQWSSGAYFHPDVATQSYNLLTSYNLWDHKEFREYSLFRGLPLPLVQLGTNIAASISTSSLLCGQNVGIFKNKSVTLSSIQDYFKGRRGYQQFAWAAAVGESPVYTRSGDASAFLGGSLSTINSTLPYIEQKDNVALIMYRANKDLALFGSNKHDVTLYFEEDKYEEIDFDRNWIIGRNEDSYVAVLRHCQDKLNNTYSCDDQDGQLWGVIVGNSDMYGSYANFKEIVAKSTYQERWIFRPQSLEWIYYGMLDIDGKKIEHYWNGNLLSFPQNPSTGVENLTANEGGFMIYPNPAKGQFALAFTQPVNGTCVVRVHDISGREVYNKRVDGISSPSMMINTSAWASGIYTVLVETPDGAMSRKLMVQE